jgi:Ras-related protein Rab-5C
LLFENSTQINFKSFDVNSHERTFFQNAYDDLKSKMEIFDKDFLFSKEESNISLNKITKESKENFESFFKQSYLTNRLPLIQELLSRDYKTFLEAKFKELDKNCPLKHNAYQFVYNYENNLHIKFIESFSKYSEFHGLPQSYKDMPTLPESQLAFNDLLFNVIHDFNEKMVHDRRQETISYKVILLGSFNSSKTEVVNRLLKHQFSLNTTSPIVANFSNYKITCQRKNIELQIWDTEGQERFSSIARLYYQDVDAAIIFYDQTSQQSADEVHNCLNNLQEYFEVHPKIYVAANKDDLENKHANNNAMIAYCDEKCFSFFETSAKTGSGIHEMINFLARELEPTIPRRNFNLQSGSSQNFWNSHC